MDMLFIGCHLSATNGNVAMIETARELNANTFAFFTRNPRGSRAKPEDPVDCEKAVAALKNNVTLNGHACQVKNLRLVSSPSDYTYQV